MLGGFKLVRRMVSGHEKDTNGANVSNVDEKATSIKSKRLKCLKDYIKKDLQRLRYKFTYKAQKIIINIPISQIIKVGRSRTRKWATIKSSSPIQHTTRDSEQVRSRQTSALTPDWKTIRLCHVGRETSIRACYLIMTNQQPKLDSRRKQRCCMVLESGSSPQVPRTLKTKRIGPNMTGTQSQFRHLESWNPISDESQALKVGILYVLIDGTYDI